MYKIYADETLIYDSTFEDYKIGKGQISLETNKSGSFVFSLYPDHFYYNQFVRLKTVITVYKDEKIIFRGRVLNDTTDYWNNKVLTCEGEMGFLQDSIIRPFSFTGSPTDLFKKFINEHNAQVDEFKRFKIGTVTVVDPNNYINRSNSDYNNTMENLNSRLIEDSLGGYFYITHGENGTDPVPTINYLADFTHISTQTVEFGSNLKNYTKTVKADDIATAIIPLGASTDDVRLTISSVNNGKDYVYDPTAVAVYGWIIKTVEWDDVTIASNLKTKAEEYLQDAINQNITIELNAIDLHLLDRSVESFAVGDYIRVISEPHNFDATMLCNQQTIDLLSPQNDSLTLGSTYSVFSETSAKMASTINKIPGVQIAMKTVTKQMEDLNQNVTNIESTVVNRSPIWGVTDAMSIAASGIGEIDITFDTPFDVTPAVVLATPLVTATGTKITVAISSITASGCHVTIVNHLSSAATVKLMYAVYPTIDEGKESDNG